MFNLVFWLDKKVFLETLESLKEQGLLRNSLFVFDKEFLSEWINHDALDIFDQINFITLEELLVPGLRSFQIRNLGALIARYRKAAEAA